MQMLPETISKNKTDYTIVKRTDRVALYKQFMDGNFIGYEVFEVKIQKPVIFKTPNGDISYPEKEKFPNDESFGHTAFAYNTLQPAEEKYNDLINNIDIPKIKGRKKNIKFEPIVVNK